MSTTHSMKSKKSKLHSCQCRICGAPAKYLHFGVISCFSCKIFFRRHADARKKKFVCDFAGQCEINLNTRHLCTACRLAKCFQCGMSTNLFRTQTTTIKSKKKTLVKVSSVQHQPERLPTLNLLQSDTSLLTTSQWTLLSNLVNVYQETQVLSIAKHLIDTHDLIKSTTIDTIYQILVAEFLACIYKTTGKYLRLNDDLNKISSEDRSIILRNAADNVSCMSCSFVMHHCHLLDLNAVSNTLEKNYGKNTVNIHRSMMKFINPDMVLSKLALSLLAFSQNAYSYFPNISIDSGNALNILDIQNKYAEITWKYLLYKYGHYEAVKRFVNLTSWLIATTMFIFHVQSLTLHVNDVNSLVEQIEFELILDDIDDIIKTDEVSS